MTSARTGSGDQDKPDGHMQRMRLSLSPRFAGDVITIDDKDTAMALYPVCTLPSCVRFRRRGHFCEAHYHRWRTRGRPALELFTADPGPATPPEAFVLDGLPLRLRLELALAIQFLAATPGKHRRISPPGIRALINALPQSGISTLLHMDATTALPGASAEVRRVLAALAAAVESFLEPPDAAIEFARDVWRLGVMGMTGKSGTAGTLVFTSIEQPWLRLLIKRFMRWRISTGTGYHQVNRDITAMHRLAEALTSHAGPDATKEQFTRETIDAYMSLLVRLKLSPASRRYFLSSVSIFLRAVRQQGWEPELPSSAGVHRSDHPRLPEALPRALPEFIMAQIEDPKALEQLEQPHRLMMQILIRTGLRLSDAYRLDIDCLVNDKQNAPYLRYLNHKMSREAHIPIDEELAAQISESARAVLARIPDARVLAPAPTSRDGRRPWSTPGASNRIAAWQQTIGLRDELGRPFRFTAHQLRHTYGTRLINADVPQEVVRRLLDHESSEMTARYARLRDDTIRRHWEKARKINIHGDTIDLQHSPALSDAAWIKENLGRATMALPNGYCGLPLQQSCPHANACLTCPVFVTTPDFLSEHLAHLKSTKRLIAEAQSAGRSRMVEMNTKVATHLENIISAIGGGNDMTESADAT